MVVEGHLRLRATYQLEAVAAVVPVEGRLQVQFALWAVSLLPSSFFHQPSEVSLQGGVELGCLLILLVELGTVEGVGAPAPVADASVPVQSHVAGLTASLVESLHPAVVAVQLSTLRAAVAVAAHVGGGNPLPSSPRGGEGHAGGSRQVAERTTLKRQLYVVLLSLGGSRWQTRYNVDGTHQRLCTINTACRSLEHLDAHDVGHVAGQVHRVVSRLRVTDVDAVQQDGDLLLSAATYAHVSLRANRPSLTDIDARD